MREYPDCFRIVEEKVKPERAKLGAGNPTACDRSRRWWQFARQTLAVYRTIAPLEGVIVTARVSKHPSFTSWTGPVVFRKQLVVFADSRNAAFADLQSGLHCEWAWMYCSTMEGRRALHAV